jgi:hypothetical protein
MSVSASIDFKFSSINLTNLISQLITTGWNFNDYGKISYLPIGDTDFDWEREELMSIEKIMIILKTKEVKKETLGIVLLWKDEGIGIVFNGFPKENSVSLLLSINRKIIASTELTDFTWYLERLRLSFQSQNLETVTCYHSALG